MTRPTISPQMKKHFEDRGNKPGDRMSIISDVPHDPAYCECAPLVKGYKDMRAQNMFTKPITCPRDKSDMKHYNIECSNCGERVAYVWSKDKYMSDWCDLHYVCSTDGEVWYGCFALNVSPVDGRLGIECSCGNDTRDFRANKTLPSNKRRKIEKRNSRGRDFGKRNSKFRLKETK